MGKASKSSNTTAKDVKIPTNVIKRVLITKIPPRSNIAPRAGGRIFRYTSSSIQTLLSVPESHRFSFRSRTLTAGRETHPALKTFPTIPQLVKKSTMSQGRSNLPTFADSSLQRWGLHSSLNQKLREAGKLIDRIPVCRPL
jgi:hypothetical protein